MALNTKPKEEEQEEGAPAWMMTYGDMMSLLLCFFIMLVAMSEIKDEKFERLLDSIKKAFGAHPEGLEQVPGATPNAAALAENLAAVTTENGLGKFGGAESTNIDGREILCKTVRDGTLYSVGDRVGFDKGSAEILTDMKKDLDAMVTLTGDQANRLFIRGHASVNDAAEGRTHWQLAFERAVAAKEYLTSKGISPRRIRLSSCGHFDPIETNLTPTGQRSNRRVEIIVSEQLVTNDVGRRGIDE